MDISGLKNDASYGAILGDIAGSIYEFDGKTHRINDIGEHINKRGTVFTDDTVMTIAIADALMHLEENAEDKVIKQKAIADMRYWGTEYDNVGYGYMFHEWLHADKPKPYGSYGNGAAMRISPVGWIYDSLEKTLHVAKLVTAVTHDHKSAVEAATCEETLFSLHFSWALSLLLSKPRLCLSLGDIMLKSKMTAKKITKSISLSL